MKNLELNVERSGAVARPLLSVLIPAYHPPEILGKCLQSVAGQTCPLEHVVLVDDASPYDLTELKSRFPTVRFERNIKNLGISANWNRCLEEAKGEFVTFLHSDDELSPLWHERWRTILEAAPADVDLFFSASIIIDIHGNPLTVLDLGDTAWCEPFPRNMQLLWEKHCYGLPFSAALIYRRSFLEKMGGFSQDVYPNNADVYLDLNSLFETKLYYLPENLFFCRHHSGQSVCQSDVDAAHVATAIFKRLDDEKHDELTRAGIHCLREPVSVYLMTAVYHALRGDWRRWAAYREIGLSVNSWGWLNPWMWWFSFHYIWEMLRRKKRVKRKRQNQL